MKNKITVFLAMILSFSLIFRVYAQDFKGKSQKFISILEPQKKLEVGETLEYSVEWLGVPVGRIILKIEGMVNINNRQCYHIVGQAIPNRFLRRLYDMEYRVHTYIDAQFLYPLRFEKIRRIKNAFTYVTVEFDQSKNEAAYNYYTPAGPIETIAFPSKRREIIATCTLTVKVPAYVQDLLSSLYYFRFMKIREGQSYSLNISYDSKNWPMDIKVDKPFYREMRKKGTIGVFGVSPSSDLNSFILGKRRIFVEFSADSRRIPILFTLSTALGPIRGIIQDLPD